MKEKYSVWLEKATLDKDLQNELEYIRNDKKEIEDRFYKDLEFGTGGLRGVIGAGTNRMNIYTIMKATQGLANYLLNRYDNPSVAIAYDSRIKSNLFSKYAATVLASNRIKVYIYPELMPTPALSFAVRELNCSAGICITASHNPCKYNGYKVYGNDGCQITVEAANAIYEEINRIDIFNNIKLTNFEEEIEKGKIKYIENNVVDKFIKEISKLSLNKSFNNLKIVYTPLNGTGKKCVLEILKNRGFDDINLVKEQANPDGDFPTCPYPNPEKEEALKLGIDYAKKISADIVLATDPDCDRVGVAVKYNDEFKLINGNEMGILLLNYISENKSMPKNPVCVSTIVTTNMAEPVCKKYNIELRKTLTGFKFIGEQIGLLEKDNRVEDFIFGFEESYGYLSGSHVRDKDAVNASMLICEMASFYKNQNINLIEKIEDLYKEYGYYQNKLIDFTFDGIEGIKKIESIMENLRNKKIEEINNMKVKKVIDYKIKQNTNVDLPISNVLEFVFDNGSRFIVRPSGTEPKIKFYVEALGNTKEKSKTIIEYLENYINTLK